MVTTHDEVKEWNGSLSGGRREVEDGRQGNGVRGK